MALRSGGTSRGLAVAVPDGPASYLRCSAAMPQAETRLATVNIVAVVRNCFMHFFLRCDFACARARYLHGQGKGKQPMSGELPWRSALEIAHAHIRPRLLRAGLFAVNPASQMNQHLARKATPPCCIACLTASLALAG